MFGPLPLAVLGLLLGIRHAIDPDHVVAVTAITARHPSLRRASLVGALWGVGHTLTLVVVGGAIVFFRIAVSPRVGLAFELAVAMMLILLGLNNLFGKAKHRHVEMPDSRPFFVGMVHGLAGTAAIVLVVLGAVSDPTWAVAYLALFGVGTIVGMVLVTTAIAMPARFAVARVASARRWLTLTSGVLSVVFGVWLASALTGPSGVFSSAPVWMPK